MNTTKTQAFAEDVRIETGKAVLDGRLDIPAGSSGIVLFAHGSGSSRHSPRNQFVARTLREYQLGTLLFDLLTREEEFQDLNTGHLRFNIELLAERLEGAANWLLRLPDFTTPLGFFGSSTGGGAALVAAASCGEKVRAVVSRGGRPDLAGSALAQVRCPALFIVGARDEEVLELNQNAFQQLNCPKQLKIVPGASRFALNKPQQALPFKLWLRV